MSFEVLESVLRPLSYWYNQENIEEVAINRAGQVWLRLRGKRAYPWVMYKDEKLTKEYLTDLLYIVANTYEIPFDPIAGSPVVYASIPGEHRFSAICGKNVMYDEEDLTGGIALTIRVHSDDCGSSAVMKIFSFGNFFFKFLLSIYLSSLFCTYNFHLLQVFRT